MMGVCLEFYKIKYLRGVCKFWISNVSSVASRKLKGFSKSMSIRSHVSYRHVSMSFPSGKFIIFFHVKTIKVTYAFKKIIQKVTKWQYCQVKLFFPEDNLIMIMFMTHKNFTTVNNAWVKQSIIFSLYMLTRNHPEFQEREQLQDPMKEKVTSTLSNFQ